MNPLTYGRNGVLHLHREYVEGCFRCDLSNDEAVVLRVTLSCGHIVTVRKGVTEARCVQCGQVREVVK